MRQCGITTLSSSRDHPRELITYLRQYGCHGVLAQTPEFAIFDPPLMFSSHLMKLTKKGELLSVQYNLNEVAKLLNLHPERFVILAALLGKKVPPEGERKTIIFRSCSPCAVIVNSSQKNSQNGARLFFISNTH